MGGFKKETVLLSAESLLKHYKNEDVEVYNECNNNRLLYLMSKYKFHSSVMAHALENIHKSIEQSQDFDTNNCPGAFLRKLIHSFCHMRVLAFGHIQDAQKLGHLF
jgi:hypothetical protein